MLIETCLLAKSERWCCERSVIDAIAFPMGDRYPQEIFDCYFADYGGLAKKYKPKRILEIGVRYGYTGIMFVLGCRCNRGKPTPEYVGVDDESYHRGSCDKANENFAQAIPFAQAKAIKHNSFYGIPSELGTFDLIHIDGNHDYHGVTNDLNHCWPILNEGGIIALDDIYFPEIRRAIEDFLAPFETAEPLVEHQWADNERGHAYIRKCAG